MYFFALKASCFIVLKAYSVEFDVISLVRLTSYGFKGSFYLDRVTIEWLTVHNSLKLVSLTP
jgi:hypothetical protein